MRTLDVTGLSDEDLGRLCTLEQLNWSVLNESVGWCLIRLHSELLRTRQQKRELETVLDDQGRRNGKLERERNRQEGTIAKQASEIEVLKNATKKCENELKRSTEANKAQRGELAQLKDENKGMKVKEDRLMEEVGKLKEEIRQRAAEQDSLAKELAEAKDLSNKLRVKQFAPSMKKGKTKEGKEVEIDVPDGTIAHLTRECGANVHDRHVVDVTCGSFEKETEGANPHSGAYDNHYRWAAKNAADLESDSAFFSAYRKKEGDIPHTRNNWLCYDFKERRIVPTHYTIRTNDDDFHLKSWLVETSADGENWREVAREENNERLNGRWFTGTFPVAGGGECRFIRLVNIGRTHYGIDQLAITAWEIFGSLIE
jgi:hypothetical protein